MKKWYLLIISGILLIILFIPLEKALTFTETRVEKARIYYLPLQKEQQFQLLFMHSIHKTDVIESYEVLPNNELRLLSMQYEDVAIGMPGYPEEGQTLVYDKGIYTLSYDDATLPSFNLFIANIDATLQLIYQSNYVDLKKQLEKGKSYVFEVKKLSLYDRMKGVRLYGERK
ncbi:DUF1850 domain-containing protein [Metasolibacillus sp.]|uniref:DUF1850 domain-containing protein n=1 Tax=Metasolibacillus sp. TaxID=2703680 RepID=UPI0025F37C7D|nr:DUF1850 domain-containing protein [Metasolibacillus sp.]MCT6925197.1 DUF1850 domain-containing protein [Metasolibacillus sp.]MCT6941445.1 DUF1850 domain-containing protein [Metasolibacillus sp.]